MPIDANLFPTARSLAAPASAKEVLIILGEEIMRQYAVQCWVVRDIPESVPPGGAIPEDVDVVLLVSGPRREVVRAMTTAYKAVADVGGTVVSDTTVVGEA